MRSTSQAGKKCHFLQILVVTKSLMTPFWPLNSGNDKASSSTQLPITGWFSRFGMIFRQPSRRLRRHDKSQSIVSRLSNSQTCTDHVRPVHSHGLPNFHLFWCRCWTSASVTALSYRHVERCCVWRSPRTRRSQNVKNCPLIVLPAKADGVCGRRLSSRCIFKRCDGWDQENSGFLLEDSKN